MKVDTDRARHFRAALALHGLSLREWARRVGTRDATVTRALAGRRPGTALQRAIDATIATAPWPCQEAA
jgi:lambda repressor-like predicted transcriptional regulator